MTDKAKYKPPIIRVEQRPVEVGYCPDCGTELKRVTDPDSRTLFTWECPNQSCMRMF